MFKWLSDTSEAEPIYLAPPVPPPYSTAGLGRVLCPTRLRACSTRLLACAYAFSRGAWSVRSSQSSCERLRGKLYGQHQRCADLGRYIRNARCDGGARARRRTGADAGESRPRLTGRRAREAFARVMVRKAVVRHQVLVASQRQLFRDWHLQLRQLVKRATCRPEGLPNVKYVLF